jgi:PAS domain S-box-containing protein
MKPLDNPLLIASLLDAFPDPVLLVNAGGEICQVNEATHALLGYPPGTLIGQQVEALIPAGLRHGHQARRSEFTATGKQRRMGFGQPLAVLKADGSECPVQISLGPLNVCFGDGLAMVITLYDLSEQLRIERALLEREAAFRQLNAELEQRVESRTAELATARAEAEHANVAKSHFMANISHEMRTPLQGIIGFAEIALRRLGRSSNEDIHGYIGHVLESGRRLTRLVESLLQLVDQEEHKEVAKIMQNAIVLAPEVLAGQAITALLPFAEQRGQRITLEVEGTVRDIRGDAARLKQVLEHLLANALRYSPENTEIQLRLCASGQSERIRNQVSFQVIDRGCGVPEKEFEAIFHPFYQSTRTATGAGGTGLGLALSRNIVLHHGGTLTVSNRHGGGAIFEMALPAVT